jgi:tetratricopeptide (TPR) repeat protein
MRLNLRLLVVILALSSGRALAQDSPPRPSMSPKAAEAFKKGLIAAQQSEWLLAIRYFEEAAPGGQDPVPEVLFNLGLAESKISGRELRATVYFGAFLAADPKSTKAALVQDQMEKLEVAAEARVLSILNKAKGMIAQLPGRTVVEDPYDPKFAQVQMLRIEYLAAIGKLASLQAMAGDMKSANASLACLPTDDELSKKNCLSGMVAARLEAGNVDDAEQIASSIKDPDRDYSLATVARAKAELGNIDGAKSTAMAVKDPEYTLLCKVAIAKALAWAGERSEARSLIARALVESLPSRPDCSYSVRDASVVLACLDDLDGAQVAVHMLAADYKSEALQAINGLYLRRAKQAFREEKADEAMQALTNVSTEDHRLLDVYIAGSRVLYAGTQRSKAVSVLQTAAIVHSGAGRSPNKSAYSWIEGQRSLAAEFRAMGSWPDAKIAYTAVLERKSSDPSWGDDSALQACRRDYAEGLLEAGDEDEAKRIDPSVVGVPQGAESRAEHLESARSENATVELTEDEMEECFLRRRMMSFDTADPVYLWTSRLSYPLNHKQYTDLAVHLDEVSVGKDPLEVVEAVMNIAKARMEALIAIKGMAAHLTKRQHEQH